MSNTPHELAEEFPEHLDQISTLKQKDAHFAKLFEEYHAVNGAVHRAETNVEAMADVHIIKLRKERLALKDQIARYLS